MVDDSNNIAVLLEGIRGEIALGEERLKGKLDEVDYLKKREELKTELYRALKRVEDKADADNKKLDTRLNNLYIKVAGMSGAIGLLSYMMSQ